MIDSVYIKISNFVLGLHHRSPRLRGKTCFMDFFPCCVCVLLWSSVMNKTFHTSTMYLSKLRYDLNIDRVWYWHVCVRRCLWQQSLKCRHQQVNRRLESSGKKNSFTSTTERRWCEWASERLTQTHADVRYKFILPKKHIMRRRCNRNKSGPYSVFHSTYALHHCWIPVTNRKTGNIPKKKKKKKGI